MPVAEPHDVDTARLAVELRVAEYKSVREEWLSSRDAQQHTLQWTLGALAVLFAAVLTSDARQQEPFVYVAIAGAISALAVASQAIWFGELMRMERAALFLRGLEKAFSELNAGEPWPPPLIWDSWRAFRGNHKNSPMIYSAAPLVIACFAIYGLLTMGALAILIAAVGDGEVPPDDQLLALILASAVVALYCASTLYLALKARSILRSFNKPAQFDHLYPPSP